MTGGGCAVATREKTAVFSPTGEDYCLHYVLYLMILSLAHKQSLRCYNLIPARFAGELSQGGLLDMDACRMAVHILLHNAYNVITRELYLVIIVLLYVYYLSIAQL